MIGESWSSLSLEEKEVSQPFALTSSILTKDESNMYALGLSSML